MLRRTFFGALLATAAGPALAAKPYRAPRTAYGAPQLEGLWTAATYTELERPKAFKGLTTTPEEARAWEARLSKTGGVNIPVEKDVVGQAQSEFPETGSGLSRIRGEIRTSHIIDPEDGQIPWSDEAKKDLRIGDFSRFGFDNHEERSHNERCLAASSTGAPILSSEDANVLQILQTRDHVLVLTEKYHDARIIRLPGAPAARGPRSWLGESVGRWEGETLVVVTDGFPEHVVMAHGDDLFLSARSRVDERFTRISAGEIFYQFTVSDPYLFKQPWRGELLFTTGAAIYEYACHEGNYSLPTILTAARLGRQPERKPAAAPVTQTAGP